jgi:hypothetical protein
MEALVSADNGRMLRLSLPAGFRPVRFDYPPNRRRNHANRPGANQ